MKTTLFKRKAPAFLVAAAVLLAAVFTVGCAGNTSGGATGGKACGGSSSYIALPLGKLDNYIKTKASDTDVNYIEVTGLTAADLKGDYNSGTDTIEASPLGKILKADGTKKVALKFGGNISGLTDMSYCFDGCESLVQVQAIPTGVRNMNLCFRGCTNLTQAPTIPASVMYMSGCFAGCSSLTQAPTISESATDMSGCFFRCSSLMQATAIPAGVTDMRHCFFNCTTLTQAPEIPAGVSCIQSCFGNCTKLTSIVLKCNYNPAKDGYGEPAFKDAFKNCTSLKKGSITVPKGQLLIYANSAGTMGANEEWFCE